MSEMLTAHAAKHAFFRDTKARFPHTSNERDGVIGATDEQIQTREQTVRTIPKKHGHKQRLDGGSQCNSSTVSDIVVLEQHFC